MIIKKNIIYLKKDTRTDETYFQVVGKTWKKYRVGDYVDIKLDLPDNDNEWVLCKVVEVKSNVFIVNIVKEI